MCPPHHLSFLFWLKIWYLDWYFINFELILKTIDINNYTVIFINSVASHPTIQPFPKLILTGRLIRWHWIWIWNMNSNFRNTASRLRSENNGMMSDCVMWTQLKVSFCALNRILILRKIEKILNFSANCPVNLGVVYHKNSHIWTFPCYKSLILRQSFHLLYT